MKEYLDRLHEFSLPNPMILSVKSPFRHLNAISLHPVTFLDGLLPRLEGKGYGVIAELARDVWGNCRFGICSSSSLSSALYTSTAPPVR